MLAVRATIVFCKLDLSITQVAHNLDLAWRIVPLKGARFSPCKIIEAIWKQFSISREASLRSLLNRENTGHSGHPAQDLRPSFYPTGLIGTIVGITATTKSVLSP